MNTVQTKAAAPEQDGAAATPAPDGNTGLDDAIKQEIRQGLAAMAETPGFRSRAVQRLMIAEVAKTLAGEYGGDERVLCIEGPTGTGKSLGYLLPAIPVARARDKTLVIATATVALQEQLVTKDLPELQRRTGMDFSFTLAKGRRRYLCDRKLERLVGVDHDQTQLDFGADAADHAGWDIKPEAGEAESVQRMWQARDRGAFNGDLDEWEQRIRPQLHEQLTTDSNGCTGSSCPFYRGCAFFTARRKLGDTDVVVANHALVMADLFLGGGVVLPEPADCIYIFDEGHHLPDTAIRQAAEQARLVAPQSWLKDLSTLPVKARRCLDAQPDMADTVQEHASALVADIPRLTTCLRDLHRYVRDAHPQTGDAGAASPSRGRGAGGRTDVNWRFDMGCLPETLRELFEQASEACEVVLASANRINKAMRKAAERDTGNHVLGSVYASAQWFASRLEMMHAALAAMAVSASTQPDTPPVARWIESIDEGRDFACYASPTSAAGRLRNALWQHCDGAVVTSATLAALGRFERYFAQAGLGEHYGTRAVRLASPFDYANNASLVVPAIRASAKRPQQHTRAIIECMDDGLIDLEAGTLVLFASYRQMRDVAEGVRAAVADRILMQGSAPRHQLLTTHRQRIDAGEGSILFGVASFSEGVDLPGRYCTHVVIAKLPFAVPDSPVGATLSEWLESRGRNPFMELAVPEAGFRLVQAAGRLLRTEEDTGRVSVLDRRIVDMAYGRMMLDSLPPFRRRIER